jgi:diguanylate cyclase (GGDEF)-like protein
MGRGLLAVLDGDRQAALAVFNDMDDEIGNRPLWVEISGHRVVALTAATAGLFDRTQKIFERSINQFRKGKYKPELAWSCHDYAQVLLERDDTGDRERAVALRDEGIGIAVELDMKSLIGRFTVLSNRLGSTEPIDKIGRIDGLSSDVSDDLTNLGNRHLLQTSLEVEQVLAEGQKSSSTAVKINLDGFRHINDSHGMETADQLLREISRTLRSDLPVSAMPCRIEPDEFCFVLRHVDSDSALTRTGTLLQSVLETHVTALDERAHVSGTAGIVMLPIENADPDQIAVLLDESIRIARRSGRNSIHVYHPDDRAGNTASSVQKTTSLILDALADDRFQLFRQSIVSVTDRTLGHYEVLIRMVNEDGSLRSPVEFIPQAESLNLIQQIDRWVISHAMQTWKSRNDAGEAMQLAINVSGLSVGKDIAEYLRQHADSNGVPHDAITVEITETAAMQDDSLAGTMAEMLHVDGFKLAIDDFGSGATSLAKVRELKFEYLKLDGILVKNLAENQSDREFVSALSKLTHEIGVEIIAEFVQDEETMEFLSECQIEYAQGYYIGEPKPFPE